MGVGGPGGYTTEARKVKVVTPRRAKAFAEGKLKSCLSISCLKDQNIG